MNQWWDAFPDATQTAARTTARDDGASYTRALLDTIAGPESAGRYDVVYGGDRFTDFSDHPRRAVPITSGPNAGLNSTAAGRYQFLAGTWDEYAGKLGLTDFSPENQDAAALAKARDAYRRATGGDLDAALAKGDDRTLADVGRALSGTWTSLPGGIEQTTGENAFVQAYRKNLTGAQMQAPAPSREFAALQSPPTADPNRIESQPLPPPRERQWWDEFEDASVYDAAVAAARGTAASDPENSAVGNVVAGIAERARDLVGNFVGLADSLSQRLQQNVPLGGLIIDENGVRLASAEDLRAVPSAARVLADQIKDSQVLSWKFNPDRITDDPWRELERGNIATVLGWGLETGLVSAPDMAAAMLNPPAYIAARTEEIAQDRAANDGRTQPNTTDLAVAAPVAALYAVLERAGAQGIFGGLTSDVKDKAAKGIAAYLGAVGKAGARAGAIEGITETIEEGSEYAATTVGTRRGFDPEEFAKAAILGGIAGGATGGTLGGARRAAGLGVEPAIPGDIAADQRRPEAPTPPGAPDLEPQRRASTGEPGDEVAQDAAWLIAMGTAPADVMAMSRSERKAAVDEAQGLGISPLPVEDAEAAIGPLRERFRPQSTVLTDEDRASPVPNNVIEEGKLRIRDLTEGLAGPTPPRPVLPEAEDASRGRLIDGKSQQNQRSVAPSEQVSRMVGAIEAAGVTVTDADIEQMEALATRAEGAQDRRAVLRDGLQAIFGDRVSQAQTGATRQLSSLEAAPGATGQGSSLEATSAAQGPDGAPSALPGMEPRPAIDRAPEPAQGGAEAAQDAEPIRAAGFKKVDRTSNQFAKREVIDDGREMLVNIQRFTRGDETKYRVSRAVRANGIPTPSVELGTFDTQQAALDAVNADIEGLRNPEGAQPARRTEFEGSRGGEDGNRAVETEGPVTTLTDGEAAPAPEGGNRTAETEALSPPRIEDFTERSVIVRGVSQEDGKRLFSGMTAKPLWNAKEGAYVFSKKRRGEVEERLAGATPVQPPSGPVATPVQPAEEASPDARPDTQAGPEDAPALDVVSEPAGADGARVEGEGAQGLGGVEGDGVAAPRGGEADTQRVVTPAGQEVDVAYEVVDMDSLTPATDDLQPRDRSRKSSDEQIAEIAAKLDPARLMPSREADRGAPIVGPDSIVESGNGRIAALRRAAETNPNGYAAYRRAIEAAGYDVPDGIRRPVLVARRVSDLSPAERRAFVGGANRSATARMSATEQAAMDSEAMTPAVMASLDTTRSMRGQRTFTRNFLANIPQSERGPFVDSDGNLSADGVRRIEQAMFARAYGDRDILARIAENDQDAATAILKAMKEVAPKWTEFRAEIERGDIKPEFDVTGPLLDALRLVTRAREQAKAQGVPVSTQIAATLDQTDIFAGAVDPRVAAFVRAFHHDDALKKAKGADRVAEMLSYVVDEARAAGATAPSMFGDAADVRPEETIRAAGRRTEARQGGQSGDLFADRGREGDSGGARPSGEDAQGSERPDRGDADAQGGGEPGGVAQALVDLRDARLKSLEPHEGKRHQREGNSRDIISNDQGTLLYKRMAAASTDVGTRQRLSDEFVREQGIKDGTEFAVVLDEQGVPLDIVSGIKDNVNVSDAIYALLADGRRLYATHNHPRSRAFSASDIAMMAYGLDPVVAVAHNGERHEGSLPPAVRGITPKDALVAASDVDYWLRGHFQSMVNTGEMSVETASRVHSQAITALLARAGAITYKGDAFRVLDQEGVDFGRIEQEFLPAVADRFRRAGHPLPEGGNPAAFGDAEGDAGRNAGPARGDRADEQALDARDGGRGLSPADLDAPAEPEATAPEGPARNRRKRPSSKSTDKIEDFGEKIEGAKKDYAAALKDAGSVDVAKETLAKSWPEPRYDKLLESGVNPDAVAFVHAARDEIPQKPRASWKLKGWVAQVQQLRDFSIGVLDGRFDVSDLRGRLEKGGKGLQSVANRMDLYKAVGHDVSLKGVRLTSGSYSVYNGVRHDPPKVMWTVERAAKATSFSNWPRVFVEAETREAAIDDFKRKIGTIETQPKASRQVSFGIFGDKEGYFIGKKTGGVVFRLRRVKEAGGKAESIKEARRILNEEHDALLETYEAVRKVPSERRQENGPRVGVDHRNGADVSPEQFGETFGFRGVQFGNYVEAQRRQLDLNEAYDALMDLAGVLEVPPDALSLNGELGLAFGARGGGGTNPAKAHYEPGQIVINLTKGAGAGSLAHEWWHGLDNYFSRKGGLKSEYMTSIRRGTDGIRPQMVEAFSDVIQAIRGTGIPERSRIVDLRKSKPYWATNIEMSARAFEAYVIAKLQDQGASNDYLANIVSEDFWNAESALMNMAMGIEGGRSSYPYPTEDEMPAIRAVYDKLVQTIETRVTNGRTEMYARDTGDMAPPDLDTDVDAIAEDLRDAWGRLMVPMSARMRVVNRLFGRDADGNRVPVDGKYIDGMVTVALESTEGPVATMHHEAIHLLRDETMWGRPAGLFTQREWANLERRARDEWMDKHGIAERYADLNESEQLEEAIAAEFAEYAAGRSQPKGMIGRAFERIRRFLEALGNALRGNGFSSAESVMDAVLGGEVGQRGDAEAAPAARGERFSRDKDGEGVRTGPIDTGRMNRIIPQDFQNGDEWRMTLLGAAPPGTASDTTLDGWRLYAMRGEESFDALNLSDQSVRALANDYLRIKDYQDEGLNADMVAERGWAAVEDRIRRAEEQERGRIGDLREQAIQSKATDLRSRQHLLRQGMTAKELREEIAKAAEKHGRLAAVMQALGGDAAEAMAMSETLAEAWASGGYGWDPERKVAVALETSDGEAGGRFADEAVYEIGPWAVKEYAARRVLENLGIAGGLKDGPRRKARFSRPIDGLKTKTRDRHPVGADHWRLDAGDFFSDLLTDAMKGAKGVNTLGLVPGRALFNELGKAMPSSRTYQKTKESMDAMRNDMQSRMDEIARRWFDMGKEKPKANQEMMDLMHQATLNGIDPSKPFDPGKASGPEADVKKMVYNTLLRRYAALPKEFRDLFAEIAEEYQRISKAEEDALIEHIKSVQRVAVLQAEKNLRRERERVEREGLTGEDAEKAINAAEKTLKAAKARMAALTEGKLASLRQQFESNRVSGVYFPLARFGQYYVTLRDSKGKVRSFSRFESKGQQRRFIEQAKADGYKNIEFGALSDKDFDPRSQVDPKFVSDVEKILAERGVDEEAMDAVWQRYLTTMPDQSIRLRRIHRKGRAGFNQDALRAFAHHSFHAAHQIARLRYGAEMGYQLELIEDQAKASDDPVRATFVVDEMRRRHDFTMNPSGAAWASQASSLAFIWYLGVTPAAAVVNLSQTTVVGIPVLKARYGDASVAEITGELGSALRDFVSGRDGLKTMSAELSKRLTGDERKAMEEAYTRGVVDKTQAHDLAQVAETGVEYSAAREKWMRRISFFFHHAERANREITFLAAYRLGRKAGMAHEAAIDKAADATWATHFDYQNTARPRFMQKDIPKALFIFRQFTVNMLWRLFRDTHQALNGKTKAERAEAKTQLIGITLSMMAHAGITGTWGYGLITFLLGAFFDDGDDDVDAMLQDALLLEGDGPGVAAWNWVAGAALKGVPGHATGVSLSERVGMPNLWFREPWRDMEGMDLYSHYLQELVGPLGGIASSPFRAMIYLSKDEWWRAGEAMVPKFVRDASKAVRYSAEGVTTLNGDPIMEEVSPFQAITQAMGFTPAELAERYEMNTRMKNKEARILDERKGLHREAGRYVLAGEGVPDDVIDKIVEFNREYPEYPITADTLRRSVQGRARASSRNEFGITINPRLNERIRGEEPPSLYN